MYGFPQTENENFFCLQLTFGKKVQLGVSKSFSKLAKGFACSNKFRNHAVDKNPNKTSIAVMESKSKFFVISEILKL